VTRDIAQHQRQWQAALEHEQPLPRATTDSGIPIEPLYTPADLSALDYLGDIGFPGEPPFTRGPYAGMHRTQLWTIRQYAGFGSAEESNARYKYLLSQGQNALSVAFDLPTQLGYDADHPAAWGEVGMVGVGISTVDDMVVLFQDLPLDRLSVHFTINATAPIILAMFLVAAEEQGVPRKALSGTLQNDILKEFLARNTYIFPPQPSLRLVGDVITFSALELPRFNPISITGYHVREAGADAIQELAFTMASACAYVDHVLARGMAFDDFAPRLSFHFSTCLDFFEEISKLRAARRLWYRLASERYGGRNPNSGRLRFFSGCSGTVLAAQEPLNNIIRSTIQCLAAVLGGAQSIHVMAYDEALGLPTEESVRLAVRTQQIVGHESGVTRSIDPLAGSYVVEHLTGELERRALELMQEIDRLGGVVKAITDGHLQRWVAERSYQEVEALRSGRKPRVGVNLFHEPTTETHSPTTATLDVDPSVRERQVTRLREARAGRDPVVVRDALAALRAAAAGDANLMPLLVDAARARATIGEITDVLRAVFGEYTEHHSW
jgi:methylmalonyl-CoA mutase N-terminal domain/subunit